MHGKKKGSPFHPPSQFPACSSLPIYAGETSPLSGGPSHPAPYPLVPPREPIDRDERASSVLFFSQWRRVAGFGTLSWFFFWLGKRLSGHFDSSVSGNEGHPLSRMLGLSDPICCLLKRSGTKFRGAFPVKRDICPCAMA